MPRSFRAPLLFVMAALFSCRGADLEEQALIMIADEARASGVEVEIEGEPIAGTRPALLSPGEVATIHGRDGTAEITAQPGEMIEVLADGTVRRSSVDPDRFVISASAEDAASFAQLLGAEVEGLDGSSRFALVGPQVTWLAAMIPEAETPRVRALSGFELAIADGNRSWMNRVAVELTSTADVAPGEVVTDSPIESTAELVGLYAYADLRLLLDASGRYSLTEEGHPARTGTFRVVVGRAELTPDDGGPAFFLFWVGGALMDEVGVCFEPAVPDPLAFVSEGAW